MNKYIFNKSKKYEIKRSCIYKCRNKIKNDVAVAVQKKNEMKRKEVRKALHFNGDYFFYFFQF